MPRPLNIAFLLMFGFQAAYSQTDYSRKIKTRFNDTNSFLSKTYFGGSAGLQFGSSAYIELSPKIIHIVTDRLKIGGGTTMIYSRMNYDRIYGSGGLLKTYLYGGCAFTNYILIENLFAHLEFETLNFGYYDDYYYSFKRKWIQSEFAGAGFDQKFGKRSFAQFMILYNLNYQILSPYSSHWITRLSFYFH